MSDGRFIVEHGSDEQWNLIINNTVRSDSGIYQCRVSTQATLLVREIHLTIQGTQSKLASLTQYLY